MLRQFLTTDVATIRAAIQDHQDEKGPKVVARLFPSAKVVEIIDAQQQVTALQGTYLESLLPNLQEATILRVQTTDQEWHQNPFACYLDWGEEEE